MSIRLQLQQQYLGYGCDVSDPAGSVKKSHTQQARALTAGEGHTMDRSHPMKNHWNWTSPAGSARRGGFALVVTLGLMALLLVLAVGLLSLSAVSLRTARY